MEKDNFYQNRSHEIFHDCKCKTENFSRTFMRELGRKAMRDFMLSVQATFSRFNIHIWYFTWNCTYYGSSFYFGVFHLIDSGGFGECMSLFHIYKT
mgnify:CR=1 FL=1|jgi:hypothetical protein